MFLPRVGQEVVVSFLEGNPDYPLITGCVYNASNITPYTLPDDQTKSTIKTNSSKGGSGFNELRFEDKAGSEEIFIQAQKDLNVTVLNNQTATVTKDYSLSVKGNYTLKVSGNLSIDVSGSIAIKSGTSYDNSAGTEMTNKAGTTLTNQASASQTVDGGGMLTLKGGLVKIN
jgi:type VI secretion system secreted protein VgrG